MGSVLRPHWWIVAPGVAFLLVFFIAPTALLFYASLHGVDRFNNMVDELTLASYANIFQRPFFYDAILESVRMSAEVTLVCCTLGYVAAYTVSHVHSRLLKSLLYAIIISPLLTSVIARSFGWVVLLSQKGLINETLIWSGISAEPLRLLYTAPATTVAVSQVLMPFVILPVISAFSELNRDVEKASSMLGASPYRTFFRVILPLTLPGLVAGGLLVFALAMGVYITPMVVGGVSRALLSVRIVDQILNLYNIPQGAALSFVLFAVTAAILAVGSFGFRKWQRMRFG